jgi:hypothetical protein
MESFRCPCGSLGGRTTIDNTALDPDYRCRPHKVEPVERTVPILLLDLDGVLNPFAAPACPDGYQERVFFEEPERYRGAHAARIGRPRDRVSLQR